ncbi:hypothetical protein, partial [Daeguia caeni]
SLDAHLLNQANDEAYRKNEMLSRALSAFQRPGFKAPDQSVRGETTSSARIKGSRPFRMEGLVTRWSNPGLLRQG